MKIIILAAGKGTRMMPLTKNIPKALLDLGHGKTLLDEQFESMKKSSSIDEVVLVVGYRYEQIEEKIRPYQENYFLVKTLYNPVYDVSNNLISLWFAKCEMNSDFLITNGDNIFVPIVFNEMAKLEKDGIYLAVIKKEDFSKEDMKVTIKDNKIYRVDKEIAREEISAEAPGLVFVKGKQFREIFKESLEELVRKREYLNKFWVEVFNHMSERDIPVTPFEIKGNQWQEIDIHLDIAQVRKLLRIEIPSGVY